MFPGERRRSAADAACEGCVMGEFKNQDKTNQKEQQDDKAAFGQFDKEPQQEQGETKRQDEFANAQQQGGKPIDKDEDEQKG
jgi:hypothetical protein